MVKILTNRLDFKKTKLTRLENERRKLVSLSSSEYINDIQELDLDIQIIKDDIAILENKLIDLGVIL